MAEETPAPPLVLVVEDYADAREMYAEYLQFAGFRVAQAHDGFTAVEQARLLLPDLILMDMALPRVDGWEATRRIKHEPATRHIPVIALTGHAFSSHRDMAEDVGCAAFITKPCLPDILVTEIRRVLTAARESSASPTA
jgi:CheY-like chemotaxis protein